MRISDWSSDVCSSDLRRVQEKRHRPGMLPPRGVDAERVLGRMVRRRGSIVARRQDALFQQRTALARASERGRRGLEQRQVYYMVARAYRRAHGRRAPGFEQRKRDRKSAGGGTGG